MQQMSTKIMLTNSNADCLKQCFKNMYSLGTCLAYDGKRVGTRHVHCKHSQQADNTILGQAQS
jgi:hypothetical protein